ncbi:MAG TPA: acyltransferase domain-containing protein, partial [Pirellulaceae bacterium]
MSQLKVHVQAVHDAWSGKRLAVGPDPQFMASLAARTWASFRPAPGHFVVAIIAATPSDLYERLTSLELDATEKMATLTDPRGVYAGRTPTTGPPKLAFLFPGQGSQYPNMGAELACAVPEFSKVIDRAASVLAGTLDPPLGRAIFPGRAFSADAEKQQHERLKQPEFAQPALATMSLAMATILERLDVRPDCVAGHSFGEYVALTVAGAIPESDLWDLARRRGELLRDAAARDAGGMVALNADADTSQSLARDVSQLWIANHNGPRQTILAGTLDSLAELERLAAEQGVHSQRVPVACAFHSPLVANVRTPLAAILDDIPWHDPRIPTYCNATGRLHAGDAAGIQERMGTHLIEPVRFRETIENMAADGTRVFLEVGPQSVLTGLVHQILDGQPHVALAMDQRGRPGWTHMLHVLGQLVVQGVPVRGPWLFESRGVVPLDAAEIPARLRARQPSPTTWIVNSVRSRRWDAPEPRLLGQSRPDLDKIEVVPQEQIAPAPSSPLPTGAGPTGVAAATPFVSTMGDDPVMRGF